MRVVFLELEDWERNEACEAPPLAFPSGEFQRRSRDLSNMQINCSKPHFVLDLSRVVSAGLEAILPMKGSDEQS
jgi:hypothetical protein